MCSELQPVLHRCALRSRWSLSSCLTSVNGCVMLHSFELWSCRCETNHFSTITSTTDCVVALVIVCSWDLWSFGIVCGEFERFRTYLNSFEAWEAYLCKEWKLLIQEGLLLGISNKTGIQFAISTKTTPWFLWPWNTETGWAYVNRWLKPEREKQRVCVERCLLSGVIWAREHDSRLF